MADENDLKAEKPTAAEAKVDLKDLPPRPAKPGESVDDQAQQVKGGGENKPKEIEWAVP